MRFAAIIYSFVKAPKVIKGAGLDGFHGKALETREACHFSIKVLMGLVL